jgi:hypothetical protein
MEYFILNIFVSYSYHSNKCRETYRESRHLFLLLFQHENMEICNSEVSVNLTVK